MGRVGWGDGNVRCLSSCCPWCLSGMGWSGWGDGNVLCYVILLSLMFVWDGVGAVGDGSSLFRHLLVRDRVGGVGDDVKFLHIERKITSVVHSHRPSHYIRTHELGWLYTGGDVHFTRRWCSLFTHRMQKKIRGSLPCPTCSAISMHVSVASFSAFVTLHHLQVFKWRSVVCCLWHPTVSQEKIRNPGAVGRGS